MRCAKSAISKKAGIRTVSPAFVGNSISVSEFAPNLMALRGKPDFYHNLINNYGYQVYVIVFDETQTSAQLKLVDGAYLDEAYERLKNPQKDEEAGFMNVIFVPDYFEQKDGGLGFKK